MDLRDVVHSTSYMDRSNLLHLSVFQLNKQSWVEYLLFILNCLYFLKSKKRRLRKRPEDLTIRMNPFLIRSTTWMLKVPFTLIKTIYKVYTIVLIFVKSLVTVPAFLRRRKGYKYDRKMIWWIIFEINFK